MADIVSLRKKSGLLNFIAGIKKVLSITPDTSLKRRYHSPEIYPTVNLNIFPKQFKEKLGLPGRTPEYHEKTAIRAHYNPKHLAYLLQEGFIDFSFTHVRIRPSI